METTGVYRDSIGYIMVGIKSYRGAWDASFVVWFLLVYGSKRRRRRRPETQSFGQS